MPKKVRREVREVRVVRCNVSANKRLHAKMNLERRGRSFARIMRDECEADPKLQSGFTV